MRTLFRGLLLSALLAGAGPSLAQTVPSRGDVVRQAVDGYIRPGYERLAAAAAQTGETVGALCTAPSNEGLDAARLRFGDLARAFGGIEFVRFGPITEDNRIERFLFWPDRRGVALRQVQEILAKQDPAAIDPDGLHAKSVAVQGLTALEFVLFGTGAPTLASREGGYRCRYAKAIAANLADMAENVAVEWKAPDGIAHRLQTPDPADPSYRSDTDALQEILGVAVHGLEAVRDLRIVPAIGKAPGDVRPNLFLFNRSGLAEEMLSADFTGLSALLQASGLFAILPEDSSWAGPSVALEFETIEKSLASLKPTMAEAAATPDGHRTLLAMVLEVRGIESTLATEVGPTLGLSTGFSSLDGD